jgi:hypothetical protein
MAESRAGFPANACAKFLLNLKAIGELAGDRTLMRPGCPFANMTTVY